MSSMSSLEPRARRSVVEERLRAIGQPRPARKAPPPEGRLGLDEQPASQLLVALADLGPVFLDFGRYLGSRVDLLPRRDCWELSRPLQERLRDTAGDAASIVSRRLGTAPETAFRSIEPTPRRVTPWVQQHDAWLPNSVPVVVTIVRSDADDLLRSDVPLLGLLTPWLDAPVSDVHAAIADFSASLTERLDQLHQATTFIKLAADADACGAFDAPRCYHEHCAPGILTLERIDGPTIRETLASNRHRRSEPSPDRESLARQLATAWLRLAVTGDLVPYDFDLHDIRVRDGRLVLEGGALEPVTSTGRARLLNYFVAAAADDPDAAWDWLTTAAKPGPAGQNEDALRRRLRQVVPFRDGEFSGDNRLAEHVLVQWRAIREAGWHVQPHQLRVYRGVYAVAAAASELAPATDALRAALYSERLRLGLTEAKQMFDAGAFPSAFDALARDLIQIPQKLDEILSKAASGQIRIKAEIPEDGDRRQARNRTVSLVASLVALVAVTFLVRHMSPAYGANLEWLGAVLVLVVGGWLLAAASSL
jgi:ubiquinone biosynthesis protein